MHSIVSALCFCRYILFYAYKIANLQESNWQLYVEFELRLEGSTGKL